MPTVTLADLRTRLRTRMGEATADVSDADLDWSLNSAKRRVQRQLSLYWVEKTVSFSTSDGTRAYALSSVAPDYHSVLQAFIIDGTTRVHLAFIDRAQEIQNYAPVTNETKKRPEAWLRFGTNIRVAPTPDGVYTISLDIESYLADLVAGGDRDAITDNAQEMLLAEASKLLMQDRVRPAEAQAWREQYAAEAKTWHDDMTEEEMGNTVIISRGINTYTQIPGYARGKQF